MLRLHQTGVGFVKQHAARSGPGRHKARIHHLQVTHVVTTMLVPIIVTKLNIDVFRLRASDADDDYPLKFSIQGEAIPYSLAEMDN